jgi:hypothetical protein
MLNVLCIAAMGATFAATEAIVANTRETEDSLNGAAGACAAGFLAGIRGMWMVRLVWYTALIIILASSSSLSANGRGFLRPTRNRRRHL